jgi:hypothetical protein
MTNLKAIHQQKLNELVLEMIPELITAANWRGWDSDCRCHACDFVRRFAERLFKEKGLDLGQYT